MIRQRIGAFFVITLTVGTSLLPSSEVLAQESCHWIGRATGGPSGTSPTTGRFAIRIEQDLASPGAEHPEARVVVHNIPSLSQITYTPSSVQAGRELEVYGSIMQDGMCVADVLGNPYRKKPGYEGYITPTDVCPTAGVETMEAHAAASSAVGCAVTAVIRADTPLQRFERGRMLYLSGAIYVLHDSYSWSGVQDTFHASDPERAGLTPPNEALVEPAQGFGKAWREHYGGAMGPLGWATEQEHTEVASWQQFHNGIVVVTSSDDGFVLHRGGAWEQTSRANHCSSPATHC